MSELTYRKPDVPVESAIEYDRFVDKLRRDRVVSGGRSPITDQILRRYRRGVAWHSACYARDPLTSRRNLAVTIDEGYIKYVSRWTEGPAPDRRLTAELETWRRPLYEAGLVGWYEDPDVGFGNLSVRANGATFVITGTQTGHLETTSGAHYALVTRTDVAANTVWSSGPVEASSEAMTHAAIYALSEAIQAVVHVHSRELWKRYRNVLPTTDAAVAYGTPAMATEFTRLWSEGRFRNDGLAVMAGHEEGIVSIGTSLGEAAGRVLALAGHSSGSTASR